MTLERNVQVRFRVIVPFAVHDSFIAIVGNVVPLGSLDPYKAPRAKQISDRVWEKEVWVKPGTELLFYWVSIDRQSDEVLDFETVETFRRVKICTSDTFISNVYNKQHLTITETPSAQYYNNQTPKVPFNRPNSKYTTKKQQYPTNSTNKRFNNQKKPNPSNQNFQKPYTDKRVQETPNNTPFNTNNNSNQEPATPAVPKRKPVDVSVARRMILFHLNQNKTRPTK